MPLIRFIKLIDFILTIFVNFILITKLKSNLDKNYSHLVILISGGFGHTITSIISASVVYKKPLIIFLNERRRLNKEICNFFFFPKSIFLRKCLYTSEYKLVRKQALFIESVFKHFLKIDEISYVSDQLDESINLLRKKKRLLYNDLKNYYTKIDLNYDPKLEDSSNFFPFYAYHGCFIKNKVNFKLNRNFFNKIQRKLSPNSKKITILYYRRKFEGGLSSSLRNGGDIKNYNRLVSRLIDEGYLVAGVGESNLLKINDNNNFITYKSMGLKKEYFNLAILNFADRFIFNPGGGSWLFQLFDKPSLGLDIYPVRKIDFNSILLNKQIDENDTIENNSWTEIDNALKIFLHEDSLNWKSYLIKLNSKNNIKPFKCYHELNFQIQKKNIK